MVASAVFITDLQGKSIINRNYRGDVPLTRAIERFAKYLSDTPDEQKKPIFQADAAGDYFVEDDVGCTGNDGETYVYINVSSLNIAVFDLGLVLCSFDVILILIAVVSPFIRLFHIHTALQSLFVRRNNPQL